MLMFSSPFHDVVLTNHVNPDKREPWQFRTTNFQFNPTKINLASPPFYDSHCHPPHLKLTQINTMADRGRGGDRGRVGDRGGFGSRGDRGGGRGRGRGRPRRGGAKDEKEWQPVTKLGRLVKAGKIKSMEEIYLHSLPIKEFQIVDFFLPKLKDEVMKVRNYPYTNWDEDDCGNGEAC